MTALPVDYSRRPWRQKYIDEETPTMCSWWSTEGMMGGVRKDGTVDIMEGQDDVMVNVPKDIAEEIIAARNAYVDVLVKHLCVPVHE